MRIAVGSDERTHLTDTVIAELQRLGHDLHLFGPLAGIEAQWPQVARQVAEEVAAARCDTGVLCCWTGTGVSIAANKVPGARAALCGDPETARGARRWNDANVLCLSLRATSETVATEILNAWFQAPVDESERANIEQVNAMDPARPYRFCPVCGTELRFRRDGEGHERPTCPACGFVIYINPKPSGNAVVVQDGKLLLVKRGIQPHLGWWDLPGGFLEGREHPEEGARREVREETGLEVEITGLVGMFVGSYPYGPAQESTLNVYYEARPVGGTLAPGSDAAGLEWFLPDQLPDEIAFRCCRDALAAWKVKHGLS